MKKSIVVLSWITALACGVSLWDSATPRASRVAEVAEAPPTPAEVSSKPMEVMAALPDLEERVVSTASELFDPGAVAHLRGRLTRDGRPIVGEVAFGSGPNAGRLLVADETGHFDAKDLHPGFAVVELHLPGRPPFEREVVLRSTGCARLDVDVAAEPLLRGRVFDASRLPVAGVRIEVDGVRATTGGDGTFALAARGSGTASVVASRPGYATSFQRVEVPPGAADVDVPPIALEPACQLTVAVERFASGPEGDVLLLLVPDGSQPVSARGVPGPTYPWHRSAPLRVEPGGSVHLDALPACGLRILAFHPGGRAESPAVHLRPGEPAWVDVELAPVPELRGRVLAGGRPIAGGRVVLAATNGAKATARVLGAANHQRFAQRVAPLPPARQDAVTDGEGRFRFGAWDLGPIGREVRVLDAEGRVLYRQVVESVDVDVVIDLDAPPPDGITPSIANHRA